MSKDKIRKRLNEKQSKQLGLKIKPKDKENRDPRYTITQDQYNELLTDILPLSITGKSTLKDKDGKTIIEWTKTSVTEEDRLKVLKSVIKALKEDIKPTIPIEKPISFLDNNLCNQYTLTDYHLGMMAWGEETGSDWDMKIAEDTLVKFFKVSIETSPKANEAIFAQIGDFMHWDGLDAVTPQNKHVLDADTRFTKLVRVCIRVIRRVIKMLLEKYQQIGRASCRERV